MRRLVADGTEVIYGADNAHAKDVLPDAIDHYSRCQRVFRTGDDLRKLVAAATSGRKRSLSQDVLKEPAWSRLTIGLWVATNKNRKLSTGSFVCEAFYNSWRRYRRFNCSIFFNQLL